MPPENLSPEAQQILALARQETVNLQPFYPGVEHTFTALTGIEEDDKTWVQMP
jgi:hypothetical protein